jgi:hypothetical protein
MRVTTFDNLDEFFEQIEESRQTADSHVEPWQTELKPGDHFVRLINEGGIFAIYGEIIEPEFDEDEENFYLEPHMAHYRFSRCFSVMCPQGELGDTHVSTIGQKLSPTQFNLAREMGWPSDVRLRKIMELE